MFYVFYWVFSIGVLFYLLYTLYTSNDQKGMTQPMMSAFGLITLSIAPKLIALIVLFGEDIVRIFKGVVRYFSSSYSKVFLQDRKKFVSKIALGLAAIPFASVLYGIAIGKYNFKVIITPYFLMIYQALLMVLK